MKLSSANISLVLRLFAGILVVSGVLSAAAQQHTLNAADFPKVTPKIDESLLRLKGKDLTERLLLGPYDSTALSVALSMASPEFLRGNSADELITELSALREESMNQLLPQFLFQLNNYRKPMISTQGTGALFNQRTQEFAKVLTVHPLAFFTAVYAEPPRLSYEAPYDGESDFTNDNSSLTAVNEYEYVVKGMTANVREETILSTDTRYIRIRQIKRETVEKNDDPNALERYVVERGTMDTESGSNEIKSVHSRRLRPTSTHRVTTEIITDAKMERCPTADGITHGETLSSITIRGTAGAMSNGSPLFIEVVSTGKATGHVNDAATLTGFDLEMSSQSRHESLNQGENLRLAQTMTLHLTNLHDEGAASGEGGELVVSGEGSTEDARKLLKLQDASSNAATGPLIFVLDRAEAEWRGGKCVELVVPSGTDKRLRPGETGRVIVEARHRYEKPPLAVPVTGTPSGGTLTPITPVRTPSATFTFTAGSEKYGGYATFNSVSRRGIAKEVNVSFEKMGNPFYKVTVRYQKRGSEILKSDVASQDYKTFNENYEDVNYSFSLLYYFKTTPKDGEQIIITPQFENNPEAQLPVKGKTIVLHNDGYSEHVIVRNEIDHGRSTQRYFSSAPMPPFVSLLFKNNDLVFVSGSVEFPEKEDELSPVSSEFSLNHEDKELPVKPKKVTDPNSAYKWVYELQYNRDLGLNNTAEGDNLKVNTKGKETVTVQIWKSF